MAGQNFESRQATSASCQRRPKPSEQSSAYPSSQCPGEFVASEDEEDEIIQALGAYQLVEGASSRPSAIQGSPRRCKHLNQRETDLYHCVYLYTIKTAVNWRQNGQSSHRDYLILAVRTRPSGSRLYFLSQ